MGFLKKNQKVKVSSDNDTAQLLLRLHPSFSTTQIYTVDKVEATKTCDYKLCGEGECNYPNCPGYLALPHQLIHIKGTPPDLHLSYQYFEPNFEPIKF